MANIIITELTAKDLELYRQFLNTGLINDEEQFRITVQDDQDAPFPTSGRPDSFTLGANVDSTLAGVVSFAREGRDREKLRHKGLLFRMYVGREYRRLGIGRRLIDELLNRVSTLDDIEQVNLTVIANNDKARNLYEQYGFKTFGTEHNAIKWKGKYFDEDQMALPLSEKVKSTVSIF